MTILPWDLIWICLPFFCVLQCNCGSSFYIQTFRSGQLSFGTVIIGESGWNCSFGFKSLFLFCYCLFVLFYFVFHFAFWNLKLHSWSTALPPHTHTRPHIFLKKVEVFTSVKAFGTLCMCTKYFLQINLFGEIIAKLSFYLFFKR